MRAKGSVPVPSVEVTGLETETGAENEPEVIGNTKEQALEVELPVVCSEDGHAVAHFTFEFNDEIIEVHQPEETWGSGKHTILLYYPIENVIENFTNTFNVYLRISGGTYQ